MSKNLAEELISLENQLIALDAQIATLKGERRKLAERKDQVQSALEHRAEASSADSEAWENENFGWSDKLRCTLRETFKLESFRPLQLSAINAVMSGHDTMLLMSTGGGKSLCYQLPACVFDGGLCLVVCPLVSLMEDQLMALRRINVPAALLNASTSKEEVQRIQNEMTSNSSTLKLLYVTPEKLAKSKRFMNKLEKCHEMGRLKLIAIDEVHCCSQWGHDFRPDYKFLNILKRQYAGVPLLGLTATATAHIVDDVREMLSIPGALVFRSGFNRPNLTYRLVRKPAQQQHFHQMLVDMLRTEFAGLSGIVYCFSRKETEELTAVLRNEGIAAACYHAEVDSKRRTQVHEKWTSGGYQVIVATVAFGMGIDKPNVRFVIHQSIAKSMENYYQESGRAGRDDKPATCILFYRLGDVFRQSTMVCTEKTGLSNLYAMLAYCLCRAGRCRRQVIADHFHERWEPDWCRRHCDNCINAAANGLASGASTAVDFGAETRLVLSTLKSLTDKNGKKSTGLKLVDSLMKEKRMFDGGRLTSGGRDMVEDLVAHLLIDGYLKEDLHFTPYSIISYICAGAKASVFNSSTDHAVMLDLVDDSAVNKQSVQKRTNQHQLQEDDLSSPQLKKKKK